MQIPAPKRLDSVEVHNGSSEAVTVTVTFDNHKDKVELHEDHTIEPGASYLFAEKELNMGSWTVSHGRVRMDEGTCMERRRMQAMRRKPRMLSIPCYALHACPLRRWRP
jgi:hypothetical protein